MYIDTHCHLTFEKFHTDLSQVLNSALDAGVDHFIVPGVDLLSSSMALELSQSHTSTIHASVGFHPYEAQQRINPYTSLIPLLKQKPIAIGECGLDYHMYKNENAQGKKDAQKLLFSDQLRIALDHDLPVIMHCRQAYDDFFDVLDSLPTLPRGVIHCFSGGQQDLRCAQERNLYIGIDGNVTYAKNVMKITPHIPLSMILLETDAPYLTPVPFRGKRNEPKHIPLIATSVATLTNSPVEQIASITTQNAKKLFNIS